MDMGGPDSKTYNTQRNLIKKKNDTRKTTFIQMDT